MQAVLACGMSGIHKLDTREAAMLRPLKYVLLGCCIAVLQSTRVTAGQTIVVAADCDVTAQIVGEWRDALATRDRKQLSDVVIEVGRQRKPGAAVSHLVECWMSRAHWTESVPSDQYTWNDDGIHITYLAGQVRILLVVPPHGSQAAMTLQEIGKGMQLVREGDAPNDVPFDSACYLAWKNHPDWVKRTLVQECMLIDSASEFFRAFRRDFAPCKDRDNLVKTLNSRPRQVGFVAYGPESDLDRKPELRCVPIARRVGWSPIRPRLEPIIQLDYPLATCLLIRRRTTDTVSANFCEFAVSEAGAKIAEKYGLVTPWRHTWYEANRRLNDVQAGRGLPISVSAQAGREKLMKDLSIEFVKAKAAVQLKFQKAGTLDEVVEKLNEGMTVVSSSAELL